MWTGCLVTLQPGCWIMKLGARQRLPWRLLSQDPKNKNPLDTVPLKDPLLTSGFLFTMLPAERYALRSQEETSFYSRRGQKNIAVVMLQRPHHWVVAESIATKRELKSSRRSKTQLSKSSFGSYRPTSMPTSVNKNSFVWISIIFVDSPEQSNQDAPH